MSNIGFRIYPAPSKPAASLIDGFKTMVTPHISDSMNRLCGVVGLKRYSTSGKLVGVAFTVKTAPGDNLMIHKALDLAAPGDVLLVDGGGAANNALVGELMASYAQKRGIAGFVIDGAIRDVAWFRDFPCYARSNIHRGPYKEGPGEINVPVSIGGLVIHPGDIVVGDEDGVVAIRPHEAAEVLEATRKKAKDEERQMADIRLGRNDRSWVDKALAAKGVSIG
jgi:RraA family protein